METVQTDEVLLEKAKALIEEGLGWGKSESWTNQDFHELSERVLAKTGVHVSAVTLKRLWGRVKYSSAPSTTTLDTLVSFIDYDNWRQFKSQETASFPKSTQENLPPIVETVNITTPAPQQKSPTKPRFLKVSALLVFVTASIYLSYSFLVRAANSHPKDYSFSSKTVVTAGLPNSVIFDINATGSTEDSFLIQQSWDERLQAKLPREQRQHTAIYYYPGSFTAKLLIAGTVVKEHNVLIESNGWLPIVEQFPIPTYLKREEVMRRGRMEVSLAQIRARNIPLDLSPPFISFYNTRNFGEIYSDDFVFETSIKNNHSEGAGICQKTYVMLQCINNMIWIPLCARGCISDANLGFTDYKRSGKSTDLSAFGVDFSNDVKLRVEAKEGKARIFINSVLAHSINDDIAKAKIIGIGFRFQGSGYVDYVKLSNDHVMFEDKFDR
jgi:hypothetical protein